MAERKSHQVSLTCSLSLFFIRIHKGVLCTRFFLSELKQMNVRRFSMAIKIALYCFTLTHVRVCNST